MAEPYVPILHPATPPDMRPSLVLAQAVCASLVEVALVGRTSDGQLYTAASHENGAIKLLQEGAAAIERLVPQKEAVVGQSAQADQRLS